MATAWSDRGLDRFENFRDCGSRVRLFPGGNAAVVDQVASGEAAIGFTDADDVRAARARGVRAEMIHPRHHDGPGGGIPHAQHRGRRFARRAAAIALVEYLLSDETARRLAASVSGNVPLHPAVAATFPDLVVDDPLVVDLTEAARTAPMVIRRTVETLREPEQQP